MPTAAAPMKVSPHDVELPARIGRFEVLMRLGMGGMATVLLARAVGEAGFQRLVALKVLHPHLLAEQDFLSMFLDEARVAARIHHPNVVAIHDLGVDGSQMYTVMDYVPGDTLAAAQQAAIRLRRGLPLPIVLRVTLDALHGLDAAHELTDASGRSLNVVHRDVTPHNVILGVDGVSRVTDFGIAKAESRLSFTDVGTLKGKAPYMAPEQFSARRVDRRADIFSMAITLWEAIALRRCLPADLAQGARRPPYRPLATILPRVPPALDAVIARALRPDPNERWRTAGEFADAIERPLRDFVATHREVAAFVRAFAGPKVDREREATNRPSLAPMRARSGFHGPQGRPERIVTPHEAHPVAPAKDVWGPQINTRMSEDETEAPTRVSPGRPTPSVAPLRGGTLKGIPELQRVAPPAPPEESEAARAFVSIPAPSIAPLSLDAYDRSDAPRKDTVHDPDASATRAAVRVTSLTNPEIPRAPKVPRGLAVIELPPETPETSETSETPEADVSSEIPTLDAESASEAPPPEVEVAAPSPAQEVNEPPVAKQGSEPAVAKEPPVAPPTSDAEEVKEETTRASEVAPTPARRPLPRSAIAVAGAAAAVALAAALSRVF